MNKKGFTLIELLVVISIIGILASLALVSYSGAQKQSRDTQRRSDLSQYRNGLETYAGSYNSTYPASLATIDALCSVLSPNFITSCPADPLTGTYAYGFFSSSTGDSYVIYGQLETGDYWEVCSVGKSGKVTGAPTDSDCDLPGVGPTSPPVIPTSPPAIPTPTSPPVIPTSSPVGTACTNNSDCSSGYCYVDADGDRYAPASGTKRCRASSQLAGADCCDTDSGSYPGEPTHYATTNACGSWDWDCSGTTSKSGCDYVTSCTVSGSCALGCGGYSSYGMSGCGTASCGDTGFKTGYSMGYYTTGCVTHTQTGPVDCGGPWDSCSSDWPGIVSMTCTGSGTCLCK